MFRNLKWMPLVAVLALAAGACDDNGTNPVNPLDFDPVATEQAVQELQGTRASVMVQWWHVH